MKLPRVFCPLDPIRLEPADERHLRLALRLRAGDRFLACDGRGRQVLAELLAQGCRALQPWPESAEPRTALWLLLALAKGERFERTLEKAAELGVSRITPVLTEHGVVRDPGTSRRDRWLRLVREAAALAGRARLPQLDEPLEMAEGLEQVDWPTRMIFSQGEPALGSEVQGPVALLIGPEGGFSGSELERARARGWTATGLGPRNLRVETAAVMALALVLDRCGELEPVRAGLAPRGDEGGHP